MPRPVIGITTDFEGGRHQLRDGYLAAVEAAGGLPVLLPCRAECARAYVDRCDGVVLSGGDDPIMERWSVPTHPKAKPIDPQRQAFELAILEALDECSTPLLGVCLGMQLMGLHRGATLDQHLPETCATAARHYPTTSHAVTGPLGEGLVHSHHRQALADAGTLAVAARADDGVIEAVRDERRPFYVGVQWHPERTSDAQLGLGLFRELVRVAGG